jgi:hypothetical protein
MLVIALGLFVGAITATQSISCRTSLKGKLGEYSAEARGLSENYRIEAGATSRGRPQKEYRATRTLYDLVHNGAEHELELIFPIGGDHDEIGTDFISLAIETMTWDGLAARMWTGAEVSSDWNVPVEPHSASAITPTGEADEDGSPSTA